MNNPSRSDHNDTTRLRALLLAGKITAVIAYFGSLIVLILIWFANKNIWLSNMTGPISEVEHINLTSKVTRFLLVPTLLITSVLGILLFIQSPQKFLRSRWWQLKIFFLLIGIPAAHYFMSSRLTLLRHAIEEGKAPHGLESQFSYGLIVILIATIGIIWLGRYKPRLGQSVKMTKS